MSFVLKRLAGVLGEDYRVERELARGGMAAVYLAHDLRHDRPVAVKVFDPDVSAELGVDRFLLEIRLAARLNHPHILPVYDSGGAGGMLYYVMPYVAGDSLRRRLERERQLPLPAALGLAREVAGALHYAHERGIVHRDIKPENILLSEGHAVVADFGIARAIAAAGDRNLTAPGVTLGTPLYMSPEQFVAEAPLDARSDVYSLGCVLYEMLAGSPPHSGPSNQVIMARKSFEPPPRLIPLRDTVPVPLERAILSALACSAADRPASAAEFALALREEPATGAADIAPAEPFVALLPFRCLRPDEEDEFLGDGICEELIHALAQVDGLRVVARTSTFLFKGSDHDLPEIGARLKVSHVVEGSLRRSGDRLRLTVHLMRVADRRELWSGTFDRRITDLLDLQSEVAGAVVERLKVQLLGRPAPAPAKPPGDVGAYEDYLRGRFHWNQRTPGSLERGVECFERALAADADFAPAHAALAACRATLGLYGVRAPREVMPLARASAERALALSDLLAEARAARAAAALMLNGDRTAAELDFKHAILGDPRSPLAYVWMASVLLTPSRRFDEAAAALERARGLDPLSPVLNVCIALNDYYRREPAAALRGLGEVIDLHPGFALAHHFTGRCRLALGRLEEALPAFERAAELTEGDPESVAGLGCTLARAGREGAARVKLAELEARARGRYVSPALLAEIHAALGDLEAAMVCMERAREERAAELCWIEVRPGFDPLRGLPGFADLVAHCRSSGRDPTATVGT